MATASYKFQKGNPGGPGRPKGSTYVDACRQWAEKKGWNQLIQIADGKDQKDLQLQATKILLEYGYGKPRQSMEHSGEIVEKSRLVFVFNDDRDSEKGI